MAETAGLITLDEAAQAIERADSVEQVNEWRAKLDAFELYMRQSGRYPLAEIQRLAELKARATWKLGELLKRTAETGERAKSGAHKSSKVQLSDLGIDKTTSSRSQKIASLPPEELEATFAEARDEGRTVTMSELLAKAKPHTNKQRRADKIVELAGKAAAWPTERYCVIYADPPWRYENPPMGASNRSIENQYPTMTLDEICKLPVADITADDAILFLWATPPKLYECMEVIDAWGFTYRTCMVWVKDKIGMGYHARQRHELLLIAKCGALPPPLPEDREDSVIEAPRVEHSKKPVEFHEMIEAAYDGLPRIELFARQARPGWAVWGNEVTAA